MLRSIRRLLPAAAALLLAAGAASAAETRVIASDASGVTLEITTGAWTLDPAEVAGFVVPNADGLTRFAIPGRPRLPFASSLIAVPPGARVSVRVLSTGEEETREHVEVAVAARPGFEKDAKLGAIATLEDVPAIRDGAWPATPVEIGAQFTVRGRHFVSVRAHPFRWDAATGRLAVVSRLVVRVEFSGSRLDAASLEDSRDTQFDAAFATQTLNWEQARTWRARRPAVRIGAMGRSRTGSTSLSVPGVNRTMAFDEDQPEVRVRVDTTGVYMLSYDSLAVYGYPANVPVAEVSVHRHEFDEAQKPPYETIDLPIEVFDNDSDGTFGPGDLIVLWVQNWAARSRASFAQREWGDAEVIFATVKPSGGLRTPHRSGWLGRSDLTPLASYPTSRSWEQNLGFFAYPSDTLMDQFAWTGIAFYCTPDQFPFDVNDVDPAAAGSLTVHWSGFSTNLAITWAAVTNGLAQTNVAVDSAVWSGVHVETRTGPLPPGALTSGTNTLKIWGKNSPSADCSSNPLVQAGLNSFDVGFSRRFKPISDYLDCNSAGATSAFEIRAGPFQATVPLAYDVTDSLLPTRLDDVDLSPGPGGVFLRLQDTASPAVQRQYVICGQPKEPMPGAMSAVIRRGTYDRTVGDYLIVVPEDFRAAIQPLADLRGTQGWNVVVASLESVQDEFNGGRKSSYAIKRFVRYAYANWNAKAVLLVGDGSLDPRHYISTSSPDIVPVQKLLGPVPNGILGREIVPSDFWYGFCATCSDPSSYNTIPDLYVGRLPVNSVSQLNGVVSKIVAYDGLSGDQSWRQKMLLVSDDAYSGGDFGQFGTSTYCYQTGERVFAAISTILDSLARKRSGLAQTQDELFNLSYYLPNRPGEFTSSGGTDTCRNLVATFQTRARATATPDMFTRLNAGRMWWNFQGHANQNILTHEALYVNGGGFTGTDDKGQLTNVGKPFLFTAFSCHPNAFGDTRGGSDPQYGPSIGEDLVCLPGGKGAIASWASVGFEALPGDPTSHINVQLAKSMFVYPPHDELLGDHGSRAVLGEIIVAALAAHYDSFFVDKDVAVTYTLLGDPATRLSIGQPQSIVTANGLPVTSGQDIRLHTAGPNLTLDATLVSTVRLDTLSLERRDATGTTPIWRSTDAALPAGFTITPAFPDTALPASRFGGRQFHVTYADALQPASYRYVFRTVDRYGLVSTFDAVFTFQAQLRSGGTTIQDGDVVPPTADLSLLVLSPVPLVPATDLTLTIGGAVQAFTATAANGDVSGREWLLTWTHSPYAAGDFVMQLKPAGGPPVFHTFRVSETGTAVRLDNAYAFPNPFDEDYLRALNPGLDVAVQFSFELVTAAPADVTLRVYTISGRLIYQRTDRQLSSSWHQMGWSGRDAEGSEIANGVYFYKLLATNGTGHAVKEGRLVKLRRPRRSAVAEAP